MRLSGTVTVFASAVLVVTLAGCTGGGSGDDSADAAPGKGELTYDDLPLAEYRDLLWAGGASPEDAERAAIEQVAKIDERVVPCMKEQGFQYIPDTSELEELDAADADREGGDADAEATAEEWAPDDRAWVESYGYGIIDYPGEDAEPEMPEVTDEDAARADPNSAYLDTLSESERAAYDEALYGPPVDKDSLDGTEEYHWEDAGCVGRASHELEVEGVIDPPVDLSEFEEIMARIQDFPATVETSTLQVTLDAEWAECMAAGGESGFTTQLEARQSIEQAYNELTSGVPAGEEETAEPVEDFVVPDAAAVEELRQKEVELALIDLGCRDETDYEQASLKIQFDLEEQFVEDNKAELDALKLTLEQGS